MTCKSTKLCTVCERAEAKVCNECIVRAIKKVAALYKPKGEGA